ncbi:uncharacterized protein N7500_008634, partial [Penicillium coprophilum]|uniref:uncharacterized protein n=1 Tax=Penicillium coprophilum TaxID=36646 RepID=UPI0023954882
FQALKPLRQIDSVTASWPVEHDLIALVGIGCHMPSGARDIPTLWELLRKEFDEPRFSAKGFSRSNLDRPGTVVARSGFLLDEDPRLFDVAFFGITDVYSLIYWLTVFTTFATLKGLAY